jgi:hypothetical protein
LENVLCPNFEFLTGLSILALTAWLSHAAYHRSANALFAGQYRNGFFVDAPENRVGFEFSRTFDPLIKSQWGLV